MKLYVSVCRPPKVDYFAKPAFTLRDIPVEVPDRSYESFCFAEEQAIKIAAERFGCNVARIRHIGTF